MNSVKQFTVLITMGDPILAVADPLYARKYVEHVYWKHCYNGCYIKDIIDVSDVENVVSLGGVDAGKANATVTFTANIVTYPSGTILNGVRVLAKTGKDLICSRDHETMIIGQNSDQMESIKIGQIIPVVVRVARYKLTITTKTEQVALAGNLFMPKNEFMLWEVETGPIRTVTVATYVAAIDEWTNKINALCVEHSIDQAAKNTMIGIYSALADNKFMDYSKAINFLDAARNDDYSAFTGVIVKDWRDNQFLPIVHAGAFDENNVVLGQKLTISAAPKTTLSAVIEELLSNYQILLENIYNTLNTYASKDVFNQHDNLWKIYDYMKEQRRKYE